MEESVPFMKELASSDRKIRDSALEKWRAFLKSGRQFPYSELVKAWSGFFVAMWHQDRPKPQALLADSFHDMALSLPDTLFLPFMRAFWATVARRWTEIDSLRMDKFLRLVRVMVRGGLEWCAKVAWREERVKEWNRGLGRGALGLTVADGDEGQEGEDGDDSGEGIRTVGDGLRYHVLDVYVDELEKVDGEEKRAPVELLMEPVRKLMETANTKVLGERARECCEDERLGEWDNSTKGNKNADEDQFEGFDGD